MIDLERMRRLTLLFAVLAFCNFSFAQNSFLKADGQKIVDGNGNNVLLRGIGLGGWMLQEGYMLETADFANTQHEIMQLIEDLVGTEAKDEFYDAWRENYITKQDVDSLAAWGFNSIRLPLHYNLFTLPIEEEPVMGEDTWLDIGIEMVDQLLEWCGDNEMYLILDLHAAPGGQGKDAAISDYDDLKPSLWESSENKRKTIALWRKLAERYADEQWIGGYDMLNEPNWDVDNAGNENGCSCNSNTDIWDLYTDIAAAIREVDQNHLVIIEGNCWGNRYSGLPTPSTIDDNLVMSFHKYWNYNTTSAFSDILNYRSNLDIPLWLGESGENSNTWYTNAISLVEGENIGWAWWPYKKIASQSGPVAIPRTDGWTNLLNYWSGSSSSVPDKEEAIEWLMEQVEAMKLDNCDINYDVLDAMFRQAQGDKSPKPFSRKRVPGYIFASDYDLGANGYAYYDADTANYNSSTGTYTSWNQGWCHRNDGVDIEEITDGPSNGYNVGWTSTGEWMKYTVNVDSTAAYLLSFRYAASGSEGQFYLESDDSRITETITLPVTGGWTTWKTQKVENVVLTKGMHVLKLFVANEGFNINYMRFSSPVSLDELEPEFVSVATNTEGNGIHITSNLGYNENLPAASDFKLIINEAECSISNITVDADDSKILVLTPEKEIIGSDEILLSYSGTSIQSPFDTSYPEFSGTEVENNAPDYVTIPAKIEAEDYYYNNGFELEDCTDTGGGEHLAYANVGDYADYQIYNLAEGTYTISVRVASSYSAKFKLLVITSDEEKVLNEFSVSTDDWQSWKTQSVTASLPEGKFTLRVLVTSSEYNLNWINIEKTTGIGSIEMTNDKLNLYYSENQLQITNASALIGDYTIELFNLSGQKIVGTNVYFDGCNQQSLPINIYKSGLYIAKIEADNFFCTQKVLVQ